MSAALVLAAWTIEATFGWPKFLFRRIRHPVVWLGALIGILERNFNDENGPHKARYAMGVVTTLLIVSLSVGAAYMIALATPENTGGFIIEALVASTFLASRSLYEHVADVARPLAQGDITLARDALAKIVGRDPSTLDEPAIARAAIESLAENTSDGVVAPLFWGIAFGLPGLAGYKAINTLDSMIGHRSDRYEAFGGFAARIDDVANFIPARLTAYLFAFASFQFSNIVLAFREAKHHRSPNAGWPEVVMASALNVRLSGPRKYGDMVTDDPWLNGDAPDPVVSDLQKGAQLYVRAMVVAALVCAVLTMSTL